MIGNRPFQIRELLLRVIILDRHALRLNLRKQELHNQRRMHQKHRVENRHRQRVITKPAQTVALRVVLAVRHHIAQIAAADLLQRQLAHVARPVVILTVDHEENRNEENNEKINN